MRENTVPVCARCGNAVYDRTLLCIRDRVWHHSCLQCSVCNKLLDGTCYSDGRAILCYEDYIKMKSNEVACSGCKMVVRDDDMVQRVNRNIYHHACFRCDCCDQPIQSGDKFYLRDDDKLVCSDDFDSFRTRELTDGSDSECSSGSGKRYRTNIKHEQLKRLLAEYKTSPKPNREKLRTLTKELGLDYRVIQVWFQNRRAKLKRNSGQNGVSRREQDITEIQSSTNEEHNLHENLYTTAIRRDNIHSWITTGMMADSVPPNTEVLPVHNGDGGILQRHRVHSWDINSLLSSCKFRTQESS